MQRILNSPWLYIGLCLATFLFGGLFQPGVWYESINLAPWTPPNIVFPIAWTLLYILVAWAGILASKSNDSILRVLWFAQLACNAAWSWLFFGEHWVAVALVDLVLVVIFVGLFMTRSVAVKQRMAGLLFAPYLAWLLLATSLNAYIFLYN